MPRLKVCLICQRYQLQREYLPLHRALEAQFDLTRHFVDERWPSSVHEIGSYNDYDAIIWFVRFRDLIARPDFDWLDFRGVRAMYDQDAYQNYSRMAGSRFLGAWPKLFQRYRFDVLICTGKGTRDNLLDAGVNAAWVPKAYDATMFRDEGRPREGICYFGELYDARASMLKFLSKHEVPVTQFKCSYFELNNYLNKFVGCVICNMVGLPARSIFHPMRWLSSEGVQLFPGPEVMLKNFEVGASGCVQFCDDIPELHELGFIDGDTMVSYRTFSELRDKIDWYMKSPESLQQIASKAAKLCREQHSWEHRAAMFDRIISKHRA